jgi:ankyrin repeat protein
MLIEQLDDRNINQVFETIKLLLHYGASMDWPAVKSGFYTPFLMLLEQLAKIKDKPKCLEILRYISGQCPLASLDIFRNGEARTLLKKYFPEIIHALKAHTEDGKIEDEKFMQELMEELMRSNPGLCIVLLYTYSQKEPELGIVKKFMNNGVLLKIALKYNELETFKELIVMGANINCVTAENLTPVEIACAWGRPEMLKHLLDENCEVADSQVPLLKLTLDNMDADPLKSPEYYQCFDVLINHETIDVNKMFINEDFKSTPLHYAASRNEFATVKLLQKQACLSTKNEKGVMPIEYISPKLLKSYFDSCITVRGINSDADYSLSIDYSCLQSKIDQISNPLPTELTKEMVAIEYMSKNKDMNHLILHPLIMSFLFLKWKKFGPIFYANLLFHLISCAAVISYIVFSYCHSEEYSVCLRVMQVLMVLKEYLQFVISPKTYISSARNYFEILFIALVGLLWIYDLNEEKTQVFKFIALIISIFVVFKLIQLLQSLPIISITIYMNVMRVVGINFILVFAFYFGVLILIELAFQLVLGCSAFKFIIDKDFTTDVADKYTLMAVIFLLSITIVMVNLVFGLSMVGNAVSYYAEQFEKKRFYCIVFYQRRTHKRLSYNFG